MLMLLLLVGIITTNNTLYLFCVWWMVVLSTRKRTKSSVLNDTTGTAPFLLDLARIVVASPVSYFTPDTMAVIQILIQYQTGCRPGTLDELQLRRHTSAGSRSTVEQIFF
uniref:Putative secreted protein n=1 Tax=Anopheles darlingi TaxID=43151 RepID=A0A2M4DJ28_ANODA